MSRSRRSSCRPLSTTLACLVLAVPISLFSQNAPAAPAASARVDLHPGWHLAPACKTSTSDHESNTTGASAKSGNASNCTSAGGDQISSVDFSTAGWMAVTVPTTIVAAQVGAGLIKDPFFGNNLRKIPGMDYPSGGNFSNLAMLDTSPYKTGWWYRTQFRAPATFSGRSVALHLDGVNYRADVWLNGKLIANKNQVAGVWRVFEFNITSSLLAGKENTLAIEVFPPTTEDLAITWVDWNPSPPDKNTGLFRDVYLTASGPVALRFPFVSSKLKNDDSSAQLTPMVEAWNTTAQPVTATIAWDIGGKRIQQPVSMGAGEHKAVVFPAEQFPDLTIRNPRLWWPAQLGSPELYHARVSASIDGKPSDSHLVQFGIRQVTAEMDSGHLLFRVNGKPLLVRGGGWAPDMLLRFSPERLETEFLYVRDMGLNTLRLEGKLERQEFYDLADKYGIMVMAGWCCCDMWERWNEWGPEQHAVAEGSQRDQLRLLRNHPSMLVWLNGSDNPPPKDIESMYLTVGKEVAWPNPFLSSASETPTLVTGPSGVKMTGPYDYVPPAYWYTDKNRHGGAWGFNTETSPGPAIPLPASMRRFLPEDKLWPQNEVWGYHEGGERFQTLTAYNTSLEHRYGAPKDYADFMRKAYAMDYEGERAMFESYTRNKYTSTGVIQWMLNNAWPSLIWHLYDYYLVPAGGYYGTKKADENAHILYSYDDRAVAVVSQNGMTLKDVHVTATLYNLDASKQWSQASKLAVTPDVAAVAFQVPEPSGLSDTYFLKLEAHDSGDKLLSENFYWLSRKPDEMDWSGTHDTAYTPQTAYADLTGLQTLAAAQVKAEIGAARPGGQYASRTVNLKNTGKSLAFLVHLRLVNRGGEDVVPSLWSDNFVSLLPGESRRLELRYHESSAKAAAHVVVEGWNVEAKDLPLP